MRNFLLSRGIAKLLSSVRNIRLDPISKFIQDRQCHQGQCPVFEPEENNNNPDHYNAYSDIVGKMVVVIKDIAEMTYLYGHNKENLKKKIVGLLLNNIVDNFDAKAIIRIVDIYNGCPSEKLKHIHPTLTESDLEMCNLIMAGFSSQQMCALTNLKTVRCLYVKKSRLKEKLNLKPSDKIGAYLASIISSRNCIGKDS